MPFHTFSMWRRGTLGRAAASAIMPDGTRGRGRETSAMGRAGLLGMSMLAAGLGLAACELPSLPTIPIINSDAPHLTNPAIEACKKKAEERYGEVGEHQTTPLGEGRYTIVLNVEEKQGYALKTCRFDPATGASLEEPKPPGGEPAPTTAEGAKDGAKGEAAKDGAKTEGATAAPGAKPETAKADSAKPEPGKAEAGKADAKQ